MKRLITICILLAAFGLNAQGFDISQLTDNNATGGNRALLSCGNNTAYQQPMDDANFGTVRTSDAELDLTVFESMVDGGGVITPMIAGISNSMRIWGASIEFNNGFIASCTEDSTALTPYNITFFDDNAGVPGNVIATLTGTVDSIVETGVPFAFTTIQEINLSYPDTDLTNVAWVSVQRQTGQNTGGGNSCLFLWLDETLAGTYDDSAQQDNAGTLGPVPSDHVMCINQVVPPQPVPSLRWYSMLALLFAIGFFSTRLFVKARK